MIGFDSPLLGLEEELDIFGRTNEAKLQGVPGFAFCFVDFVDFCSEGELFGLEFSGGFFGGFKLFHNGFGSAAAALLVEIEGVEGAGETG